MCNGGGRGETPLYNVPAPNKASLLSKIGLNPSLKFNFWNFPLPNKNKLIK